MNTRPNNAWIQTYTGKAVDPADLKVEDIDIRDIAHHLSQINRFTGAAPFPYSVAQHSILCSALVPPEDAMWALLHDATEAYLTDISSPLKAHLPDYKTIEARAMKVVCAKFGLSEVQPASVSVADQVMLSTEARDLFPEWMRPREWRLSQPASDKVNVLPAPFGHVREAFIKRFLELGGQL